MRPLTMVLALSENGVIGREGKVPWHYPEDLKHFRLTTEGHAIIMGRKTFLEVGKPLLKRRNLVVSTTLSAAPGIEIFRTLGEAIEAAYVTDDAPCIIGGQRIFEEALPLATTVWLTRVHREIEGDVRVTLDLRAFDRVELRSSGDLTFERWIRS